MWDWRVVAWAAVVLVGAGAAVVRAGDLVFCCAEGNDLYQVVRAAGAELERCETAGEAVERVDRGGAVLVLADGYPEKRVAVGDAFWAKAREKGLRVYVEYPEGVPGVEMGEVRGVQWERAVVSSDTFGERLKRLRILGVHGCRFVEVKGGNGLIAVARVAGYDTAVYGLPEKHWPLLTEVEGGRWLVGTTKLSGFVTGRYAPTREWGVLWEGILKRLAPGREWRLTWTPVAGPAHGKGDELPKDAERRALAAAAEWVYRSGLLLHPSRESMVHKLTMTGADVERPADGEPVGDGTHGLLEGYASLIRPDGSQTQRTALRADSNTEEAMVLAMDWSIRKEERGRRLAENLLDYVYVKSGMCGGERGDPKHPAFGHIAWGAVSPAWMVANYGDDNARVLLATIAASAALGSDKWDVHVMRGLLANLRTTGKNGFRGDRVDMPALSAQGWRAFHDAETVNYAPHFEAYLWACYLWGYAHTGEREFLEKAKRGIGMTMAAYPGQWRWGDNIERARMLLALAWLVRVDDTAEHRGWVKTIARDLLAAQHASGAIQERLRGTGGGHYQIPQSNEAYGTAETPLIQSNDDPASDQLYTTGFAVLALHEAAAATGDEGLKRAEDRLADFLVRVQVRSEKLPYLDGAWFRAFDYGRWDYWASSADLGWGVWSVEAGWGQAWIAATLGMREKKTTLWEMTKGTGIKDVLERVKGEMAQNDGGPAGK